MQLAAQFASRFVRGNVHVLRIKLFKYLGIPYPWLRISGMVRLKTDQPWPQPSPISASMPYAVLHVSAEELKEFLARIVRRFQRQVTWSWLSAIAYLKRTPHLSCPDDPTFTRYLTKTVYTYFLTDVLDPADRQLLAKNGISSEFVLKSDLTPVSTVDPFPGLYITGSVCYFRESPAGDLEIIGIAMVDRQFTLAELIRPSDGNSWKSAKMHVLQGATYLSLFVTHPKVHFPIDAIIAVTKTFLPKDHRIAKLLEPHTYLQLPLDYSVLHIRNGPSYNDQRLYYTAFSGAGASQCRLFGYSHEGFPGHAAFPPYTFGYLLRAKKNDYLSFLFGYHEVILEFVRTVLADVEIDDLVQDWVKHCAHYSRGFGRLDGKIDKEELAASIATVIWNCSVVHSADHYDFFRSIPMEHKPTRLRIPPPFQREECAFDEKDLTNPDDRLRQYMWNELYVDVTPWTLTRLYEVDYEFAEEDLNEAARDFKRQLASYESGLEPNSYIPLREIATSIQY